MGNKLSKQPKQSKEKINKNHSTRKGFQFGVSFGKDSVMEAHLQIGWTAKTVKNYTKVPDGEEEPKNIVIKE